MSNRYTIEYTGDGVWAVVDRKAKPGTERHIGWYSTKNLARIAAHKANRIDPLTQG